MRRLNDAVAFADVGCGIGNILLAMAPYCDELYGWDSNPDLVPYRKSLMQAATQQMANMGVECRVTAEAHTIDEDDDCFAHVTETSPGVFWMNDHAFDSELTMMIITKKLAHVRSGSLLVHFQYIDDQDIEFIKDITTWKPTMTYVRPVGVRGPDDVDLGTLRKHVEERLGALPK